MAPDTHLEHDMRLRPSFAPAVLPWLPGGTNGVDFVSAEGALSAERPLLSVTVTSVREPASALLAALGGALVAAAARRRRSA
jgi:hypothetical protein